jgi:hypothetical protein
MFIERAAGRGLDRLGIVLEHDAGQQLVDHLLGHRMLAGRQVDLGHMVARRGQAVDELAVVGQQQHAGGVLVEPAHRLHPAGRTRRPRAQRRRQQGVDAGPGAGLLRAFMPGRLVQHQVGMLVVLPGLALDRELEALGLEIGGRVGAELGRITDRDMALLDQAAADASRAKALGIEDFLQLHGE